ncbi:DUF4040 domain-containing protein [Haloarcula marina]|uniref:DUF4040 domain-containing protein n=1 Tax=Haloarcula marina TaxID=2961574 RepID=UPI0020B7FE99|nr:DUF4040 domain-containing protein [Halomicroarcula marina]
MIDSMVLLAVFGLLVLTAVLTALLRNTVVSVIAFAAYSLAMTLVWVRYRAPDVALTEAAVGAGVMTVLFLAVLSRTRHGGQGGGNGAGWRGYFAPIRWRAVLVSLAFGGGILATVPALPAVGAADTPAHQYLAAQYLALAPTETGVTNVVTAILAAYRGFDTFGEAVVVFMSGIAVLVILKQEGLS